MSTKIKGQDYDAKAQVDSSNVDAFDPERFMDMVQTEVQANLVMEETAMVVNRELVGSPGSSIKLRQVGATTVNEKSEGTATAETNYSHDNAVVYTDPSATNGYVLQANIPFTDIAAEDSNLDEMQIAAEDAGIRHAEARDQRHYDLVIGATQGGASPADGEAFSADLSSGGQVSYSDVKDLAQTMRQNKYKADSLVISHDHLGDLLDEDKFILANQAGTTEGLRDGVVGRMAGLTVYVTQIANGEDTSTTDAVQGVILDSDRAWGVAVKREPRVEEDRDPQGGVTSLVVSQRFGNTIVDANGIGLLVNA